jgi:quaternary ammonium compound-resistance protein SugE
MLLSGLFLYLAQRSIPISTAYIIWTGMGAVVTLILGIALFHDDASPMRLFFALLIIIGVIGLECRS